MEPEPPRSLTRYASPRALACRRILVPTDFSESSELALRMATALARDQSAEMLIVHVAPPRQRSQAIAGDPDTLALSRLLDQFQPPDPRVIASHRLVRGQDPAETLLRLAEDERIDLIVMAMRQRSGISQWVLGSVAQVVVSRAPCPVLAVRGH